MHFTIYKHQEVETFLFVLYIFVRDWSLTVLCVWFSYDYAHCIYHYW